MKKYEPEHYSGRPAELNPHDLVRVRWYDGIITGPHPAQDIGWNKSDVLEYENV